MKQWMAQPGLAIFLIVSLALVGVLVGHGALAQGVEPAGSERIEGEGGKAGQILGLTPEQLSVLQPPDRTPLYHFSGALSNSVATIQKATVVQCTNVDDTLPTQVEVQLFDYDALDVFTATISVGPLRTVTFESIPVAHYQADVFINASPVDQGYGRILTEHSNVICAVQTVDPTSSPPSWSFDIPLYRRGVGGAFLPLLMNNMTP